MSVHKIPLVLSNAERLAWLQLMGSQAVPDDRDDMTRQAKTTYDIRCEQSSANLAALSELTELAETLNVFGGKIDTQSGTIIGKRPACVPASFRTVDAIRMGAKMKSRLPGASNE